MHRTSPFLVFVVFLSVSVFAGPQLLTNPGFEDGDLGQFGSVTITGWGTVGTNGSHHSEPGNVIDAKAVKIYNLDSIIRQDFTVTAGKDYLFTVKMLSPSSDPLASADGICNVRWYNGVPSGATLMSEFRIGSFVPGTDPVDTWKTFAGRLVAPTSAVYARIILKFDGGTSSGTLHFDDASVRQVNMAADLNDDNVINHGDFALLASDWQEPSSPYSLDGVDGIYIADLLVLGDNWLIEDPGTIGYALVWADEFNGTSLNMANWEYMIGDGCSYGICGWGNNELQYYRAENVSVSGGYMTIEARAESYGGKSYTSARIRTINRQDFLYGRLEARMQLPTGGGMWPAFWMMPTDNVYGGWAASGEIDIMESSNDTDYVGGTIHFGGAWPDHVNSGGTYSPGGVNFSDDFHVYTLEWEPDVMRWYVDGILFSTKTSAQWYTNAAPGNSRAPFDQYFHFLLNVAVGGNYTGCTSPGCITATLPQQMTVDWIRVYQIQ